MIELPLYDIEGKQIETLQIDETLFGTKPNKRLMRDMVVQYEANKRVGTAQTKTRKEVQGASRKLWKQKHTGRARIGTIRSPIWRHGGTIFGPHPRDYSTRMPKQMRQAALDSALLSKFSDKETLVITDISADNLKTGGKIKTKNFALILKKLNITRTCLVGIKELNKDVHRAAKNIANVHLCPVKDFNAYDVLKNNRLLLTKDALESLVQARQPKGA